MSQTACRALGAALMPLCCVLQGASEAEDEETGHGAAGAKDADEDKAIDTDQERLDSHSRAGPRQHPSGEAADNGAICKLQSHCLEDWRPHGCHMAYHILCG